jgi:toxin YoeB
MKIVLTKSAIEDLEYWKKSGNVATLKRIQLLLKAIAKELFEGIGKPEALKYNLSGSWSRRINKEHRIVYEVTEDKVIIKALRFHY